jgi:competence protein ComEC
LLFDLGGAGAPFWKLTGWSISLLLGIARTVAATGGAVATLASMPAWAFGLMIAGGLWICLWTSRVRLAGLVPILFGMTASLVAPTPDILVTGDGRHLAVVHDGVPTILRERSGDYIRSVLSEAAGFDGDPHILEGEDFSHCSRDSCVALVRGDTGSWRLLATRSATRIEWLEIVRACGQSDIVVSDRWLPASCNPRWLKLDRKMLEKTGGVAIYLGSEPGVESVSGRIGRHPWAAAGTQ